MAQQQRGGKPARRVRRGFRSAADNARQVLESVAGSAGFAEADVLLRWPQLVGAALAATCRPVRVSYGGDRRFGATLMVRASGPAALEIKHLEPQIIERINQVYGYRAISRLRVTQSGGRGGLSEDPAKFSGPAAEPTDADRNDAAALTGSVEDPALRETLTRLGANVLARRRAGARRDDSTPNGT